MLFNGPILLVSWLSGSLFLSSLHWPVGDLDLVCWEEGISYVELLILYELWAGERLRLEKAHPRYLRPGRQISVSAVPFGPGIDIWRSCRFIGALMMSLCFLAGGLGRFVPWSLGANHCQASAKNIAVKPETRSSVFAKAGVLSARELTRIAEECSVLAKQKEDEELAEGVPREVCLTIEENSQLSLSG